MKILQKYANGGNVATEKRDSAGGNTVYNFLDLSNDLKGKNGKNRVYNRGDGAGFSSNIVFLENEIKFKSGSQFNNILSNLSRKGSGNALIGPSSGGLGSTNIVAVRTKTNSEGQIEIVSVITDASLKDGAGDYQKGGYYSEITNPAVTGKPIEVFQFEVQKGAKEGLSDRRGYNQVDLDRTFGRYGNYNPKTISTEIFKSLSNKLTVLNEDQWYSDELKDDYSIQKLNYTNYFMPTSNEKRNVSVDRPFTTAAKIPLNRKFDINDPRNMDRFMNYLAVNQFGYKSSVDNKFFRQYFSHNDVNLRKISREMHNQMNGGFQGFIYKKQSYKDIPRDYQYALDTMIKQIIGAYGASGELQGMLNENGEWNREVLDKVFQINNVDGVNYLTLNTGGYMGAGESKGRAKNTIYNFKLDGSGVGEYIKESLNNHIIKHSPIMTQSLSKANSGEGNNFTAEGPNLAFNIKTTSPVDGTPVISRHFVGNFNTESEAAIIAENYNNKPLEERIREYKNNENKYISVADVTEDTNGTVVNVVDFNSGSQKINPLSYQKPGGFKYFKPTNTIFISSNVELNKRKMQETLKIDKITNLDSKVQTHDNTLLPTIGTYEKVENGTGIVTEEEVTGSMGDWTNEELAATQEEFPYNQTVSKGSSYNIQKGDTLTKIARDNNTTIENIMDLNPFIKDPNKIYAGDNITLKLETKDGLPSYQSVTKENPFGGIPAGTEQENKQIYLDGQLQNWDSQNKRWSPATETKRNKENLVDSTLSQNNDKNIMLDNLNQSGNQVVEEISSEAGNVSGVTNVAGNIMKKYFENQKKKQEEKDNKEEESKDLVNNKDNKEEEEERKVPMATQKSAGVYVDEQGERIPQTQLHNYEIQEMDEGGVVRPMFAAGYSYTKKEKEEEEGEDDDKKTKESDDNDPSVPKKPKLTIRQRIDEMLKRKARKQRTKKELKESGEWKNLSFAEKRLTLKKAKEEGDYKKGAIYKNPNVK